MLQFDEHLSKVRTKIMLSPNTAFIASLMLSTDFIESHDPIFGSTNGESIKINPTSFTQLSFDHQAFVVLHELWHIALFHVPRSKGKDFAVWQEACDHVVNLMLIEAGFVPLPDIYADRRFSGMHVEAIYDLLMENKESNSEKDDSSGSSMGDDLQPEDTSASSLDALTATVATKIQQAANSAKMQGKADSIPEGVREILNEINNPELPWDKHLLRYMTAKSKNKTSWFRRNRRVRDMYLPSKLGRSMGEVHSYLDASGSISLKELSLEAAEMAYIFELTKPSKMVLHAFSHYLGEPQTFTKYGCVEDFEADAQGGTDLQPVWDNLKKEQPQVAIIFTDGYVNVPPLEGLKTDIIFVIVNNPKWNHADHLVLHMSIDT